MSYAKGKYAFGFCDKTGFRYPLKDLVYEYKNGTKTGFLVGKDVADPDQPQNFLGRVKIFDPQSLRNPRPDTSIEASRQLIGWNPVGNTAEYMVSSIGTVTVNTTVVTQTFTVTVANPGSGNRYYIDGALQPTLTLSEGQTYLFDWSAATSHPLRFSITSDGTHGGGVEYTTGVVKDDSAYTTQITVAYGAPTLYYYCQIHPNMGGQINTT